MIKCYIKIAVRTINEKNFLKPPQKQEIPNAFQTNFALFCQAKFEFITVLYINLLKTELKSKYIFFFLFPLLL